jgi:type III restriction enzyme
MSEPLNHGISAATLAELRSLFEASPGIERVWIFGSRARGNHREVSDIDLAVDAPGWADADFQALLLRVAQMSTLYKLDVVHWQRVHEPVFRQEIERDRRVLWQPERAAVGPAAVGGVALKDFQRRVLDTLGTYIAELRRQQAATQQQAEALRAMEGAEDTLRALADYPRRAWDALRKASTLPPPLKGQSPEHQSRWDGAGRAIPNVCLKVPTGGGKTLLAAAAVGQILHGWLRRSTGLVLWVVPNEAIYTQTLKALSNRDHPYRQLLNVAGAGRVKVLEKASPLSRQDVDGHLCVMLLMLAGANRRNKETLKFFADSGRVSGFLPLEDNLPAHHALLQAVPNLDAYGSLPGSNREAVRAQIGSVVKSSLGNVMRLVRPVVVIDEGHHAYSEGALQTIDGFNPSFMLELSATPRLAAVKRGTAASGSNVLADVRGTDLDAAEMIKLPINVDVRGWSDWRSCLSAALEQLDALQREAEALQGETSRYIRPILLVQVERTGAEHRDAGYIHAEDAREQLLALGLQPRQIAVKTSERNELAQPENIDLLSPTCQVRAIITKQALQEGWDCPFAYVLCALAAGRNLDAMKQLVGRVLRLPHVAKTGRAALDACFVLCHDAKTGEVVQAIKQSLEDEGMGDLALAVRGGESDPEAPRVVQQRRRSGRQDMRLFVPKVTWVESDGTRRDLVYESDVLAGLDWQGVDPARWVAEWAPDSREVAQGRLVLGLELLAASAELRRTDMDALDTTEATAESTQAAVAAGKARIVRALSDLTPGPWLAWAWLGQVEAALQARGLAGAVWARSTTSLIDTLRAAVEAERDRLAEAHFAALLAAGRIEFRLRADRADYELPQDFEMLVGAAAQAWMRPDGLAPMQHTLFEPALRTADINEFEHRVAGWLDEQQAVRWWHRNVARTQLGLQGWKRDKVYPDFVLAIHQQDGSSRTVLLETKGLHLKGNDDTRYKQALLKRLSEAFQDERHRSIGSLALQAGAGDALQCELVFQDDWQGQLNHRLFGQHGSTAVCGEV